jgi:hypothetical protein
LTTNTFVNEPSRKIYEFLQKKMSDGELTGIEIANVFGAYQKNPSSFFGALKTGKISITVDQILKAQQNFGLNPCDLFDKNFSNNQVDENWKITDPALKEIWELVKSQQQTIHQLVTQRESKGGSM